MKTILTTKSSVIRRLCWQWRQSWQQSLLWYEGFVEWRQSWQRSLLWYEGFVVNKDNLNNEVFCDTKALLKMKMFLSMKSIYDTKTFFFFLQSWQRSLSVIRRLPSQPRQRSLSVIRRLPWRRRRSWRRRLHWRRRLLWWWKLSMQGCALVSLQWSNCQCNNLRTCFGIFALDVHWLLAMILF